MRAATRVWRGARRRAREGAGIQRVRGADAGGRAGARPRKGLRPVPSLCPPSLACLSLVPLPGLSLLPLQAPAVRSAARGGVGGRRDRGDRVSGAVLGRGTTCWEAPQRGRLCAPGYLRLAAGCSVVSINVHPVLHHLKAHWMGLFSEVRAQVVHLAASLGGRKWIYVNR